MTSAHAHDTEITVTDARGQLPRLLDNEVRDGGRVYLTRNGRRVGALVPVDVAEHQEEIEDVYWSQRAAAVLEKNEPTIAWDVAVAMLETGEVPSE